MQYQVMYRLIHSEYLPTTSTQLVHAHTHYELTGALARLRQKWETRGYHVRLLRVEQVRSKNT